MLCDCVGLYTKAAEVAQVTVGCAEVVDVFYEAVGCDRDHCVVELGGVILL